MHMARGDRQGGKPSTIALHPGPGLRPRDRIAGLAIARAGRGPSPILAAESIGVPLCRDHSRAAAQLASRRSRSSVPSEAPLGADVSFSVTFNNNDPTNGVGYGPVLDVILDTTGADGDDGLGTTSISAEYATIPFTTGGANPTMWILTFDPLGQATHPLFRDSDGDYEIVIGTPGDTLVVLRLPFGSFAPDQPPATVNMTVNMSTFADVSVPLSVEARGGYEFGFTPLDDWCCGDAASPGVTTGAISGWTARTVTPTLLTLSKSYSGPEDETATGPNFPRQYTVTLGIAPGQDVTDLVLTDLLPGNMQFNGPISSSPAGADCTPPAAGPGGTLTCSWPDSVPNSASLRVWLPHPAGKLRQAHACIDPVNGDDVTSCNQSQATANWLPLDPRDQTGGPFAVAADPDGCEHTLTNKSIAIQKGVTNLSGAPNGPGDTLEYTLTFQISDFFAFDGLALTDLISDGQSFDSTLVPTMALSGNGFSLSAANVQQYGHLQQDLTDGHPIPPLSAPGRNPATNGMTTVTFDISGEVAARANVGGCPLATPATMPWPGACSAAASRWPAAPTQTAVPITMTARPSPSSSGPSSTRTSPTIIPPATGRSTREMCSTTA